MVFRGGLVFGRHVVKLGRCDYDPPRRTVFLPLAANLSRAGSREFTTLVSIASEAANLQSVSPLFIRAATSSNAAQAQS